MKKIKGSKRGLTFTTESPLFSIGTKYRYIINKNNHTINIIPDEKGPLRVSRKKSGNNLKPLFDIRSKEVKDAISASQFLEIEVLEDRIVIYTLSKKKSRFKVFKNHLVRIDEVLGVRSNKIIIPIAKASGAEMFHQYTIEDWFEQCTQTEKIETNGVASDLTKIYDVVSLFSGAGLFDKAWLDSGRYRFVYANDFCEDVIETYTKNIGDHIVCKDIRNVNGYELPFADVFSASPCCQAYSNSNRHNMDSEEAEEKRLLVEEIVRLVKETKEKPKVIVVENVPQLLTKENGLYVSKLMDGLSDYEASVQLIEDCKVGGYTHRQRAIVIFSRIGKIKLPNLEVLPTKTVKDALSKVDATWFNYHDYSIPKKETVEKMKWVKPGGNWRDIPKEVFEYKEKTHSNVMRRLALHEIAPTVANVRKDNMMPPEGNRCLSVAEAAALMGLDKTFKFYGKLSSKQQMVANGVTQAIGKLIRNTVTKALDSYENQVYQM